MEDSTMLQGCKLVASMPNVGYLQAEQSYVSATGYFIEEDNSQQLIINEDFSLEETSDGIYQIIYIDESSAEITSNIENSPIMMSQEICTLCRTIDELQPVATCPLAKEFENFLFFQVATGYTLPECACKKCLTTLNTMAAFMKTSKESMANINYIEINEQSTIDEDCSTVELVNDEENSLQLCEPAVEVASEYEFVVAETVNDLYVSDELVQEETVSEDASLPEEVESTLNTSVTSSDHLYYKSDDQTKTCPKCQEMVTTLKSHYNKHPNCRPKRIRCYFCSMRFRDRHELSLHQTSLHPDKSPAIKAICHICSRTFKHASNLTRHLMMVHEENKPFTCDKCDKKFPTAVQLEDHANIHSNIKAYLCEDCGKQFSTKVKLSAHVRVHRKCNLEKSMTGKPNTPAKNSENELLPCNICGRQFLGHHGLKIHLNSHNERTTYSCQKCKIQFENRFQYREHNKTHTVKDAECPHCHKMFTRNGLKMHVKIHTEGLSFSCPECKRKFRTRMNLANHRFAKHDVNTGRPFECQYCDKVFKFKGNRTAHVRTHTGEKPYECPLCGEAFADTKRRKVHIAHVHGEDERENVNFNYMTE